ncbi:MAG TPA: hypothetical protein VML96_05285, partial [Egibacteraceae bacterium]|nr:hypothetical protein [Egibacteraceae bacterium]
MGSSQWDTQPSARWRQALPVAAILVVVVAAGSLLSPSDATDSGAILGVQTDVPPTPRAIAVDPADRQLELLAPTPAASPDPTAGLDEIAGEWIAVPPSPLGRRVGSVSAWI